MLNPKSVLKRALTVGSLLVFLGAASLTAYANNEPYDGTDPNSTGCAASAWNPVPNVGVPGQGTLELRFSSNCLTAWARFTCWNTNGCTNYTLWVKRVQDQKDETQHVTWPAYTDYGTTLYTLQLYDGGSYQSYACFQGYFGAQAYCTSAF